MLTDNTGRNRGRFVLLILMVVLMGISSRSGSPHLPIVFKQYGGDVLWASAVYLTIVFFFPRVSAKKAAITGGLLSLAVEMSQTYHSPLIDGIRQTRIGGLILGHGFLWSDLICYGAGVGFGVFLDWSMSCFRPSRKRSCSPRRLPS